MSLCLDDFPDFFDAVTGHRPFAWQSRLMRFLIEQGTWPERIDAPTGGGKSSVIYIHVFANALMAAGSGPHVPRRLCAVVGRRGLVDNQADQAIALQDRLREPTEPVLQELRSLLLSLTVRSSPSERRECCSGTDSPLLVTSVRGGLALDNAWLDDPLSCSIINATPDMWGSRLLFRGYMGSALSRPRSAGLLAYDSVLVLDEAHLNRQLECTARRVSSLAGQTAEMIGVPALQVVSTTATQTVNAAKTIGVLPEDVALGGPDPILRQRWHATKTLSTRTTPWNGSGRAPASHIAVLADAAASLHVDAAELPSSSASTVGCVVNRVRTALALRQELARRDPSATIEVWVGPMRPYDLNQARQVHPSLFTLEGDRGVDYLITTQTVEVGVDIDLAGLVTELAPASALAQRAGRVNRQGARPSATIVIAVPEVISDSAPYGREELTDAHEWLRRFIDTPQGLSPAAVASEPPPVAGLARVLLQRPEWGDVWRWSITSRDWFESEDIALWLRDDLSPDQATAGLVVRDLGFASNDAALALLRAIPPMMEEVFPSTLATIEEVLTNWFSGHERAYLLRDGELAAIEKSAFNQNSLSSGDLVILPAAFPCSISGVLSVEAMKDTQPVPLTAELLRPGDAGDEILEALFNAESLEQRLMLAQEWAGEGCEAILPPEQLIARDAIVPWLVKRVRRQLADDEANRELLSMRETPPLLEDHLREVGARAEFLGVSLGVTDTLCECLRLAGEAHDLGKADPRFQTGLGRLVQDPPLAKGRISVQATRRRSTSLPLGWRHEQLSVGLWEPRGTRPDVTARLIGTSHGHGTMPFRHTKADLWGACADERAQARMTRLFEDGEWERLMQQTSLEFGAWGIAFLESLLRAADCQISKEGS